MDRLEQMELFVRVVDCGSFTQAAQSLDLPRSTVSTAVKALEKRIGARLLNRTTRTLNVTDEGRQFYQRATALLREHEALESLFTPDMARPKGTLRVNVPGRLGRRVLAPALPGFLARYPDIDIELGVTDRAVDLVRDGVDCVIRVGELADSNLIVRRLGTLPLCSCASPAYLSHFGVPNSPQVLADHRMVGFASSMQRRVEDWEYRDADGQTATVEVPCRVTVNTAEALIACGLAGLGLIQVPLYDVRHHLDSGSLISVMANYTPAPMPISILYPHREHMTRRLDVFIEWVSALLHEKVLPAPQNA